MSKGAPELRLHRDEKGELYSFAAVSPNLAIPVEVLPITYGQSRSIPSFGEEFGKWSDEDKLTLLQKNVLTAYKKPFDAPKDLDDMYNNFDALTVEDLVLTVILYSGFGRMLDSEKNFLGEAPEDES